MTFAAAPVNLYSKLNERGLLKYIEPDDISNQVATSIEQSGTIDDLRRAVIRIAFNCEDRAFAEAYCIRLTDHSEEWVRGNAMEAFGHLARRFGVLDGHELIKSILSKGLTDSSQIVRGKADDALDDLEVSLGWERFPTKVG